MRSRGYGRIPGDKSFIECIPPLKVVYDGKPRLWDVLLHTCEPDDASPCLACGYRDCPTHHPQHYALGGCPACR